MEIFLHQRTTEAVFIKVDPSTKFGAFGIECLGDGASVWLEDGKEMLDLEKTLAEAGVVERCHVHVSSCKAVVVKVRFAGQTHRGVVPTGGYCWLHPEVGCKPRGLQAD